MSVLHEYGDGFREGKAIVEVGMMIMGKNNPGMEGSRTKAWRQDQRAGLQTLSGGLSVIQPAKLVPTSRALHLLPPLPGLQP